MTIKPDLIAPCGMNCSLCSGYQSLIHKMKDKGIRIPYCAGCRIRDKKCAFLKKRCPLLLNGSVEYCFECDDFPCEPLQHIDARYRKLYKMSMIENLLFIKKHGIERFLESEEKKWMCPTCGNLICCHNGICFHCGVEQLKKKKKMYRWSDD